MSSRKGFTYAFNQYSVFDIINEEFTDFKVEYNSYERAYSVWPLGLFIRLPDVIYFEEHRQWTKHDETFIYVEKFVRDTERDYIVEREGLTKDEAVAYLFAEKDMVYNLLKKRYRMVDDSFTPTQQSDVKDYNQIKKVLQEHTKKESWLGIIFGQ